MKLLIDMNLSPLWLEGLTREGFEAVHWSAIGKAPAPIPRSWSTRHGMDTLC